jgi:hypothetical protein
MRFNDKVAIVTDLLVNNASSIAFADLATQTIDD